MNRKLPSISKMLTFIIIFLLVMSSVIYSQATGDYRTVASGGSMNWNSTSTWQRFDGAIWQAATNYPGQSAADAFTVTVRGTGSANVTLNVSPAFDIETKLVVESGATLDNGSNTLRIRSGADFFGTYTENTGTLNFTNDATITIDHNEDFYNITLTRPSTFLGSGGSRIFTINGTLEFNSPYALTLTTSSLAYLSGNGGVKFSATRTVGSEWTALLNVPNVILQSGAVTISSGTRTVGTKLTRVNGSITGTVAYSASATLEYAPSSSNVTVGNEWPSGGPDNVTVNNSGKTVTSSALKVINRTLTMTAGTLAMGTTNLTVNGTLSGSEIGAGGTVTSTGSITMGNGAGPQFSQSITGSVTLSNLTIDKNNAAPANNVLNITGSPTITNNLTITNGDMVIASGKSITISSGNLTLTSGTVTNNGTVTLNGGSSKITVSSGATFTTNTGATSIKVTEIDLASTATYVTGGKSITSLSTLTLDANSTFEFSGSTIETLPLSGSTFGNINMNNVGGLNVLGATTVDGILTFSQNGTVNSSSTNMLTLGTTASISGATSSRFVNGPLRKAFLTGDTSPFTYPIGFSTFYKSAIFNYDGNNSAGISIIEIEAFSGDPGGTAPGGISAIATSHYYTLNEVGTGGTTIDYDITLTHTGTGFTDSRIKILRQTNSGPSYEYDSANNGTATSTTQILSNQTALPDQVNGSIFAFGTTSGTVTWVGGVDLDWESGGNWSTGVEPTSVDDVVIDIVAGVAVTLTNSSAKSIKSLTLGDGADGTITLNITNTNAIPLTISGSVTVDGEAVLTINGTTGGISISGTLNLNAGAVYNIASGSGTTAGGRSFNATSTTNISSTNSGALRAAGYGILNITSDQSVTGDVSSVDLDVDGAGTGVTVTGDLTVTGALSTSNGTSTITVTGSGANYAVTGATTNVGVITASGTGNSTFGNITSSGSFVVSGTSGDVSIGTFTNTGTMTLSNANSVSFSGDYSGNGTITGTSGTGAISFVKFKPAGSVDLTSHSTSISDSVFIAGGTFTPGNTTICTGALFQITGTGSVSNSSGTITFGGGVTQRLRDNSTAAFEFNNLIVDKTANNMISYQDLSINGTLTMLNGLFIFDSGDEITLNSSVTGGSAASYLNLIGTGQVLITGTTSEVTVPLGDGGFMRSIGINPSNSGSVHSVRFYYSASSNGGAVGTGLDHVSDKYYWTVAQTGTPGNANVKLHWGPNGTADDGVNNYATLLVAQWDGVSQWISRGGTSITASNDSGSVTSTPSFSIAAGTHEFTLGSSASDNSLPVELSSFTAENAATGVMLKWHVESELDNQAFIVERRVKESANDFELVDEVEGRGTVATAMDYEYLDQTAVNESEYEYRLLSRDYSGLVHEYDQSIIEITVDLLPDGFALEQNYPNPFNPTTTIGISLSEPATVELVIYDISGRKISTLVNGEALSPSRYNFTWDGRDASGRNAATGVYFYRLIVNNGQQVLTKKMILVK